VREDPPIFKEEMKEEEEIERVHQEEEKLDLDRQHELCQTSHNT